MGCHDVTPVEPVEREEVDVPVMASWGVTMTPRDDGHSRCRVCIVYCVLCVVYCVLCIVCCVLCIVYCVMCDV